MLSLILATSIVGPCHHWRTRRVQCVPRCQPVAYTYSPTPVATTPQTAPIASEGVPERPEASTATADPYGFLAWLNATRASIGLGAVAHDANLAAWAAMNNASQAAHGLGHWVMGPARRQNAGWGPAAAVWPAWVASSGHAAALFDPSITAVGIAWDGAWWTFSAN